MIVRFGRKNGQQTEGEIVKVNPKRLKIKQIGERGVRKAHREGTVWTVHPSLVELVNDPKGGSNFGEGWETIEVPTDTLVSLLVFFEQDYKQNWQPSTCKAILRLHKIPTKYHAFLTAAMMRRHLQENDSA
jgi:hypothetical protein